MGTPGLKIQKLLKLLKGDPIDEVLSLIQSIDPHLQVGAEMTVDDRGYLWTDKHTGREDNPVKVTPGGWTTRSKLALEGTDTFANHITLYVGQGRDVFNGHFQISDECADVTVHLSAVETCD